MVEPVGPRVLAFESSCDELAVAVLEPDGHTLGASVVHSQIDLHARYGGVVPEIASRDHVRRLDDVLDTALEQSGQTLETVDAFAVTQGPGLVGCLLCGLEYVKGLAVGLGRPLVGVHHLEAHLAAADLEEVMPELPYVALLVSGGHTHLIRVEQRGGPHALIGATRDDAAGEAFDKTAKLLGLGYPGGVAIDRLAAEGDAGRFPFPAPMPGKDNLDFSFSGLKTAAQRQLRDLGGALEGQDLADFCAGFQRTIVDNLLKKSFRACRREGLSRLVLAGGVAANSELRERALERGRREQVEVFLPSRKFCTDNAAMVARAGWLRWMAGARDTLDLAARPSWPIAERR
ncbi:MAG: tRNA (adenosine(37)-N6)-threonylcarbamoyltransferase complex transferase subunit TsaD [Myxococcota bacterium]